jgi:addiction module HigA family antidote
MNCPVNKMPPVHPGEILREDFLIPLNMNINSFALALHISSNYLQKIIDEQQAINADLAERLARYFGGDAVSWLNLQALYDLKTLPNRDEIIRQIQPRNQVA